LIDLQPAQLVLSAVKRSEDGTCTVVRFFNPCGTPFEARVGCFLPILRAELANLAEEPVAGAPLKVPPRGGLLVPVGPGQIITVRLHLGEG
jgi:alpha-mannosidase